MLITAVSNISEEETLRIKDYFNKISTESTKGVWIHIKRLKYPKSYSGVYKNTRIHRLTQEERIYIKSRRIKHIIVIRIGKEIQNQTLANLIAHEYAHLLQYHNGRPRTMLSYKRNRERHANKWAEYRLSQLGELE